ncbi:MAG: ABC transporter ATP-binding protein [Bdellovibrionaceae bacterium]|nr:ABC transporter ATP-binding protein [Pseudobdellovibrionaceae bacterium]
MNDVIRRLLQELRPYKSQVILVAVTGVFYSAAYSRIALFIGQIQNSFQANEQHHLTRTALMILGLALVVGVSRYFHIYTMNMIAERIVNNLRLRLQRKFMNLSLGFHANYATGSGGLMSRILNDIKVIQDGLRMVADFFREPLLAVLLVGNLFYLNWRLTFAILIVVPPILWFLRRISRSLRKYVLWGQENQEQITSTIKESLDGVRTIQSFNLENVMSEKLTGQTDEYLKIRSRVHSRIEVMGPVTEFVATCLILGIFFYFSVEIAKGNQTPGDVLAYIASMLMINAPIKKLQESYVRIQETVVAARRVYDLLDEASEVPVGGKNLPFPKNWSRIVYRNVSFAYGDTLTLKNIDLEIRRGEQIALVGESGSGKSTLVNLLGRFHDPTEGQILIDDTSLFDFDLKDLRQHIALVSQDVFLFSDTIQRNIHAGDFQREGRGVSAAARSANAHDFISRIPNAYENRVGDRGSLLSGGEKQRISIARAIFKDAPILILDEATSALDSSSEKEVQKGLDQLMKGRTSLVVAHRLSTVQNADRIIVMRDGRIVEEGRHADLVDRDGHYSRFWRLQAKS